MKISPFEKASVSNVKDLILTLVSIRYFKDVTLNPLSDMGIILCLTSSLIFSVTLPKATPSQQLAIERAPLVDTISDFD